MALKPCTGLSPADWITTSELPWWQLVTLGPAGFEAYARLRFIPDPEFDGQSEGAVEVSADHPSDIAQLRTALALLAGYTSTPDSYYLAYWDGWGLEHFPPDVQRSPQLQVPERSYYLLRGQANDLMGKSESRPDQPDQHAPPRPAFVWPADRAWCITADVDPHWAGIAASHATMSQLFAGTNLDLVPTDPGVDQPHYW